MKIFGGQNFLEMLENLSLKIIVDYGLIVFVGFLTHNILLQKKKKKKKKK